MRNIDGCHRRAWDKDSSKVGSGRPLIVPKVRYEAREHAEHAAARLGQRAYRCGRCKGWHTTARGAS